MLTFHVYGFFVGLGVVVGAWISKRIYRDLPVDKLFPWVVIPAIFGARIYNVIDYWIYYQQDPVKIFYLWEGGLGIYGAIAGGIIGLLVFSRKSFFPHLDAISFGLPIGQAIGRIGNYFNRELYPIAIYEAIWDLLIFIILIIIRKKKLRPGSFFFLYLGLYGSGRFFLEFLRIDPWRLAGINVAQGISLSLVLISLIRYKQWNFF